MSILKDKKVLLGVTGGIAAYKAAELVRALIKKGANVKVVLTKSALDFVTPLTLSTLSKNPVNYAFYNEDDDSQVWNNHVELALWADYFIIAPATANTLSKMCSGTCDNLLLACYLSAKCPVYFAPAMDLDMYKHPSTFNSFQKLASFGNVMIPSTSGELASGLIGQGRMAEPVDIVSFVEKDILNKLPLKGQEFLITAGPTYEPIDPVRFIGNHSSGKMGIELALNIANKGAQVNLILGPSSLTVNHPLINLIQVTDSDSMFVSVQKYYCQVDVAIAAAAVADYKPKFVADEKIKKKTKELTLELVKTQDILLWMGQNKKNQRLVGFALETQNEIENAISKLNRKNLDLIVLNSLKDAGAGFKHNTNKVTLINAKSEVKSFDLKSKAEVAEDIVNEILSYDS